MKIRIGFVSNSSSSSFICINYTNPINQNLDLKNPFFIQLPEDTPSANLNFGWDFETFSTAESKLAWAAIQISHLKNAFEHPESFCDSFQKTAKDLGKNWKKYFKLLNKVVQDHIGKDVKIHWNYFTTHYFSAYEGTKFFDKNKIDPKHPEYQSRYRKVYLNREEVDKEYCSHEMDIDHQSLILETRDYEIFHDYDTLRSFLFCSGSYVRTGNDNEENPDEE